MQRNYRGICIDENTINSGKMVYGFLIKADEHTYIIEVIGEDSFIWNKVKPETVGQSTGLPDKNGKEVYEGDILEEGAGYYFEVVWEEKYAKFKLQWKNKAYQYPEWNRGVNMQVIGNIYDNPELLQEVDK